MRHSSKSLLLSAVWWRLRAPCTGSNVFTHTHSFTHSLSLSAVKLHELLQHPPTQTLKQPTNSRWRDHEKKKLFSHPDVCVTLDYRDLRSIYLTHTSELWCARSYHFTRGCQSVCLSLSHSLSLSLSLSQRQHWTCCRTSLAIISCYNWASER